MFVSETDSDKWGNLYPGYREILIKLNMKHCTQWYRFSKIFKPRIIFWSVIQKLQVNKLSTIFSKKNDIFMEWYHFVFLNFYTLTYLNI